MLFFIKRNVMFISKRSLPSVKSKSNDIPEILFILNETKVLRFRLLRFLYVFFLDGHIGTAPTVGIGMTIFAIRLTYVEFASILPLISVLSSILCHLSSTT